jgi:hypothetical protein
MFVIVIYGVLSEADTIENRIEAKSSPKDGSFPEW